MRTVLASRIVGLIAALGLSILSARAEVEFSAGLQISSSSDFYQPLAPYGAWVDIGTYGRCWHPSGIAASWRPYCTGHWEWTDCGWYWVSDESWSWACYHYGSWVDDPRYGWCWIPGTEWAPAWVTWRESPDYIGWAPCGPGGAILASSLFVFVDTRHFHDPIRPGSVIVNNTTIISRTRVISDVQRETRDIGGVRERVVVNQGPGVDSIRRATGQTFQARPIHQVAAQTAVPETVRRRSDEHVEHQTLRATSATPQTGREQQRSYQQQPQQPGNVQQPARQPTTQPSAPTPAPAPRPVPSNPDLRQQPVPPPTGRETPRESRQAPQPPPSTPRLPPSTPQPPPSTPQPSPSTPRPAPPREVPHAPQPQEVPRSEPSREVPRTPPQQNVHEQPAPTVPQERTLPPTGREGPPARQVEPRPQGPPQQQRQQQQQQEQQQQRPPDRDREKQAQI